MQILDAIRNALGALGASVVIPVIIFVICLILGAKFKKSLIAGLTFAAAYIGLNLVIGLMLSTIAPMANTIMSYFNTNKTILDVGWQVGASIAYSTPVGSMIILVSIGVNILMIALKATKTLNVDVWNFWNHAFTASAVYIVSGSLIFGLFAGACHAALCLIIADRTAKRVQEFYNVPGVSIPHGWAVTSVPIIFAVNWILDRIPFIKDIQWDEKKIQEKWGIFGNPLVLGCVLGLALGLLAGYWRDIPLLLQSSFTIGAVMLILPRFVGLFMESLSIVSESAKTFMAKRFKDREFYIGLDSAILIGHPVTISASLVLIPIVILLSVFLPGNKVLALGDLASLAYFVALVPCLSKGNLFRSIICGTVIMACVLWLCTSFGSSLTTMAVQAGYELPAGTSDITALSCGNWITWIFYQIGRLFGRA